MKPTPSFSSTSRALSTLAVALGFAAVASAAQAAGGHGAASHEEEEAPAARNAKPPAMRAPVAGAAAKAGAGAGAGASAHGATNANPSAARDPLDIVRERLAEKLGATKPPEAPNPNVLRVVSRASTTDTAPSARMAAGHDDGGTVNVGTGHTRPARATTAPRSAAPAGAGHGGALGPSAAATAALAATVAAHANQPAHWDYQGTAGPDAWGKMKPEFDKCSSGTRQSPIDIRDGIKVQLDAVQFDYRPTGFRVIDNGHTVQVNLGGGNTIEVQGRRYELLQFHFHRPSEERVNGRQFEMVAHLVHKDPDGKLAVVAVLLDRGAAQPLIQTVWNNLPLEKGEEVAAQTMIDLNALLPADRSYYTYMGSLTTPPCSEGVLWMVLKNPVAVSQQQVAIFSRLYPMNARPVQAQAGRLIKESN